MNTQLEERIEKTTVRGKTPDSCHRWIAGHTTTGFAKIIIGGQAYAVRRVMVWLEDGYLPPGECIRCSCGNNWCVNPGHFHDETPLSLRKAWVPPDPRKVSRDQAEKARRENKGGKSIYRSAKELGVSWSSLKRAIRRLP